MTTPEQLARQQIDALLTAAGWAVQDYAAFQPNAALLQAAFASPSLGAQ